MATEQQTFTAEEISSVKSKYQEGLTWRDFCRAYAEEHSCNYLVAVSEAGPLWKIYKEAYEVEAARVSKKEKSREAPKPTEISYREVPKQKSTSKKNPDKLVRKKKVAVPAPPKGYKLKTVYEKEEDSDDDDQLLQMMKMMKLLQAAKKPSKKVPAKQVKQVRKVVQPSSSEDTDDYDSGDE